MAKKDDEFFVAYLSGPGPRTSVSLKRFVGVAAVLILVSAFSFAFFQHPFSQSSFDFDEPTKVSGTYHESPYPMLRVQLSQNEFKDILLLGFGKFGANPYLKALKSREGSLAGKQLLIEGNLIYYNGKTLLQIDDSQKVSLGNEAGKSIVYDSSTQEAKFEGEVIDPKCYFGVMKPGFGKIHRSCASLCISGGIPPVLANSDPNSDIPYLLLADENGDPINNDILPFIGQPLQVGGQLEELGDWHLLKINTSNIEKLDRRSSIY